MIRVLHYIGELNYGGSQTFVLEIYRKIDKNQFQFDFVTFPNQQTSEMYKEIIHLGGRIFECPQYNGKNHFQFTKWWNDFFKCHPEYRIIHGHVRSVSSIYLWIARKSGCFTIAHSHSVSNGNGISGIIKNIYQLPTRFIADYMLACSNEAGRWMFGNEVVHRKNYKVLANAIDTSRFCFSKQTRAEIRHTLTIDDDVLVLGHVGRMTEAKNHKFLIDLISELKNKIKVKLLLVGDGELKDSIENYIIEKKVENECILVGSRKNTQDYYQAMDIFVFPSHWEGFGISLLEAQANGLPCIVSDTITKSTSVVPQIVHYRSVNDREEWINAILNTPTSRCLNTKDIIIDKGYDISTNVMILQNIYKGFLDSKNT